MSHDFKIIPLLKNIQYLIYLPPCLLKYILSCFSLAPGDCRMLTGPVSIQVPVKPVWYVLIQTQAAV